MPLNQALGRAFTLHQQGHLDEAERQYLAILKRHPGEVRALNLLARVYLQAGQAERALQMAERAITAAPAFGHAWHTLGLVRHRLGDHIGAVAAHEAGIARGVADAQAHNNTGVACQDLGRLDQAAEHFRQAVAADPNFVPALVNLGVVFTHMNRPKEAEEATARAVQLAPKHVPALVNLGLLRLRPGDLDGAEPLFKRALALAPGEPRAVGGLAMILERRGSKREVVDLVLPLARAGHVSAEAAVALAGCAPAAAWRRRWRASWTA